MSEHNIKEKNFTNITDEQVYKIRKLSEDMKFGTITLVFQDGLLIQLERNEKIRLPKSKKQSQI